MSDAYLYAAGGAIVGYGLGAAAGESAWGVLLGATAILTVVTFAGGGPSAPDGGGGDDGEVGGGAPDPTMPWGPERDALIRAGIAYAKQYGYTISARGGWLSAPLMTVDPMGAVVLRHDSTCSWDPEQRPDKRPCDYAPVAAAVLSVPQLEVEAFHAGFKGDTYNFDLPGIYAYGQAYRREFSSP